MKTGDILYIAFCLLVVAFMFVQVARPITMINRPEPPWLAPECCDCPAVPANWFMLREGEKNEK